MTCIIVTHEIAFAREVADQIYLVIEHALSGVMTSPTDCGVPR
jgi:ABC-type polar amino acid transport system ATPase subunit